MKDEVDEDFSIMSKEASTVTVELSVTTSLKENCSEDHPG